MKNKILRLKSGLQYYVLDEIVEEKKTYIFAMQVDNDTDATSSNYIVCYYKNVLNLEDLALCDIEDKAEYEKIVGEFLKRFSKK